MKKMLFATGLLLCMTCISFAQNEKTRIYNPEADALQELQVSLSQAGEEDKHVLLQVGGNWCPWCKMLHRVFHQNSRVDSVLQANYVLQLVNYSKENKNKVFLKKYEYPHRFGFPVLVVLDEKGRRLHTQNTVFLEEGKGYNKKRLVDFLKNWSPEALKASNYDF